MSHPSRARVDATAIAERMAIAARREGCRHPAAAAVVRAARTGALATPEHFAASVGCSLALVAAAEAGEIPFAALPDSIAAAAQVCGVDLLAMADLARALTMAPSPR